MPFTYPYPRPSLTADVVLFAMGELDLSVLLIKRKSPPFKGSWALPGGFVDENEPLEKAARRELEEETSVTGVPLEQLGAFGDPGRDPRGHTVSVAYYSFVHADSIAPRAGDDAKEVAWVPLRKLALATPAAKPAKKTAAAAKKQKRGEGEKVALAFDHGKVIESAFRALREQLDYPVRPTRFSLVPQRFTLAQLRRVYEAIAGSKLHAGSFNRRILASGFVVAATKGKGTAKESLYRFAHET